MESQNTHNPEVQNKITPQVEALLGVEFQGNVVPHHWYKHITFANGKPYTTAILLLSDIVYWYRPTIERNEGTGEISAIKKKFRGEFLQRQTKYFAEQFGFSEKQVRDALKHLEEMGFIKRHFLDIKVTCGDGNSGILTNRQYIELIPSKVLELQKIHTYRHRSQYPPPSKLGVANEDVTYTKTKKEIKKENILSVAGGAPASDKESDNPQKEEEETIHEMIKNAPYQMSAAPSKKEPASEHRDSETGPPDPPKKITIKTWDGPVNLIETDMYLWALRTGDKYDTEELKYAWSSLCDYKGKIRCWQRFIEGTIENMRQKKKSEIINQKSPRKESKTCPAHTHKSSDGCRRKSSGQGTGEHPFLRPNPLTQKP